MQQANAFKRFCIRRKNKPQNVVKYAKYLEAFASKINHDTATLGYVLGLSGGIDSSLALAILSQNTKVVGVFIDIESSKEDRLHAESLQDKFKFEYKYINLTKIYLDLVKALKIEDSKVAKINLKSRLRSNCLYALANKNQMLTCGTTNADEKLVGYYTKFGDNACDLSLLCYLTKANIRYLAGQYQIPNSIIDKQPSAGLYVGQTDEADMGITYQEIDHYLSFAHIDPTQEAKINTRYVANKHKLNAPIKPKRFISLRNVK